MLLVKGSWLDGFLTGLFVFFFNFSKMKTSPFLARSFRTYHSDYKKKNVFHYDKSNVNFSPFPLQDYIQFIKGTRRNNHFRRPLHLGRCLQLEVQVCSQHTQLLISFLASLSIYFCPGVFMEFTVPQNALSNCHYYQSSHL